MPPSISLREQMLGSMGEWGNARVDIVVLALVGSGARFAQSDHPADEWSDIDLVLVTPNAGRYLNSSDWLGTISEPWDATVESDPNGKIVERRVLFRKRWNVSTRWREKPLDSSSSLIRTSKRKVPLHGCLLASWITPGWMQAKMHYWAALSLKQIRQNTAGNIAA